MIKIKEKIIMNKKILISNKKMEIAVLEEKGAERTETLEMSFERAKELIFENNHKVGHIEIRSEKPFDVNELALAMMFESWAYFPSGMGMAGSRKGAEFTAEGEFTLRMPEKTVIFHKEFEDPYGKKGVEMLNRYSRYLKAVFTGKNEFEIDMEYPIMAHVNSSAVLENGKINHICIKNKEIAEDMQDLQEKIETADRFYVSIMHDYLGFAVDKNKKEVSLYIEAVCGTIFEFWDGKWKANDNGYKGNEYYEFFFRVSHLLDIFERTIKKYTNDDLSEYFDMLKKEVTRRTLLNADFNQKEKSSMESNYNFKTEHLKEILKG